MTHLNTTWKRIRAYLHAWFVDHEVIRILFRNFYSLSENAYRSNHPSPKFVKKLNKEYGVKTIISMRRADTTGAYLLEKEACDKYGITLINHPMSSRALPEVEKVLEAKTILENAEYPILLHCKSGADRAGLMSVFYKHFIEKHSIDDSLKELSMKYGHFRWAETGKLDYFFDNYLAYRKLHPGTEFIDWLQNNYDREKLDKEFHSSGWANIVVNKILNRE